MNTATPLGLAAGAGLLMLACAGAGDQVDGEADASPPPEPPLPAVCHVVSDDGLRAAMPAKLLIADGGRFAGWLETDLNGPVTATLALAAVDDDLVASETVRVGMTSAPLGQLLTPQLMVPVGESLLVLSGHLGRLVPVGAPHAMSAITIDVGRPVAGVALDSDRVALLDATSLDDLRYRVLDVRTREVTLEVAFAHTPVDAAAAATEPAALGQALRLLRLADGDLLALWVAPEGARARGLRLRSDGTVVAGPADIAVALPTKGIFVPDALELPGGHIAIAWTGTSGTEVRVDLLPADLAVDAGSGVVINETLQGSQDYASLVRRAGALAVVWATAEGGIRRRALEVVADALVPAGGEADAVAGCAARQSFGVGVASPSDDPVAIWTDHGWEGAPRVLVERVR
jgi:hypothetical protein